MFPGYDRPVLVDPAEHRDLMPLVCPAHGVQVQVTAGDAGGAHVDLVCGLGCDTWQEASQVTTSTDGFAYAPANTPEPDYLEAINEALADPHEALAPWR